MLGCSAGLILRVSISGVKKIPNKYYYKEGMEKEFHFILNISETFLKGLSKFSDDPALIVCIESSTINPELFLVNNFHKFNGKVIIKEIK